jgi:hypothetical protein
MAPCLRLSAVTSQDGILRLVVHLKKSILPWKKMFQATRNRFAGHQKSALA